jgi:hypothetical protein
MLFGSWGFFRGDEGSGRDLLGCDAVQRCGRIPTFRRTVLPEDGDSNIVRNIGILQNHNTMSQPRRPQISSISLVTLF